MKYALVLCCAILAGCANAPKDDWKPPASVDPKAKLNVSPSYFEPCGPIPLLSDKTESGVPLCGVKLVNGELCEEALVYWFTRVSAVAKACRGKVDAHIQLLKSLTNQQENNHD